MLRRVRAQSVGMERHHLRREVVHMRLGMGGYFEFAVVAIDRSTLKVAFSFWAHKNQSLCIWLQSIN